MEHIVLPAFDDDRKSCTTHEVLEAEPLGQGRYRLLHSPAFVDGLAAGDVIDMAPDTLVGYRLVSRSGNLAVLVAFRSTQAKESAAASLAELVLRLGGRYDGGPGSMAVATIPVAAGFPIVERSLAEFVRSQPDSTWWFGNVYGDDGTPLGWWNALA